MKNNLKPVRLKLGFSQAGLSRQTGVSVKTIANVENGRTAAPRTYHRLVNGINRYTDKDRVYTVEDIFPGQS